MSSNDYILKLGASGSEAVIAGQLDGTMTKNGTLVDITDKSDGGKVKYLNSFVAGDQVSFAGTFTVLAETVQNTIKAAEASGTQIAGIIETAIGGESWQCDTWAVTGRSDSAGVNGAAQMSITFSTSGAFTYTAPS
tara:strand:- start:697 stop:1104 length:408 start_codon:yes stop_codon:yes gene_type:complete